MKNKFISIFAVFLLILTGLSVIANPDETQDAKINIQNLNFSASDLMFKEANDYVSVELKDANTYTLNAGEPMLPVIVKVYNYPIGTKITNVECTFTDFTEIVLESKVAPAPIPVSLAAIRKTTDELDSKSMMNQGIYIQNSLYPENEFTYQVTRGMNGISLAIRLYTVRYNPAQDIIQIANNVDIQIDSEETIGANSFDEEFDLVIIAPSEFSESLQPLIDHKNNHEMKTFLKTTEEIYEEYEGRDKPEQIKYFIKDAFDTNNISYVLLVGGLKGQRLAHYHTNDNVLLAKEKNWYVPVRYANNNDGWETGYISDLYYADIYDANNSFSSWDTNDDGIFSYFSTTPTERDIIDFHPDVYVGRLACRNLEQVETMVAKIIAYEENTNGSTWFNKTLLIAGDTFPPSKGGMEGYYEGEIATQVSADFMSSLNHSIIKLWGSTGTLEKISDITSEINPGVGYIHITGHANPTVWSTFKTDDYDEEWLVDFFRMDMDGLVNGNKLPIVVVGGCHNSQFDVNLMNLIRDFLKEPFKYFKTDPVGKFWHYEWVNDCWSWHLTYQEKGGSIATIGNTGLGYGYINGNGMEGLGGWLEAQYFNVTANPSYGYEYLGQVHSQAITNYINYIGYVNTDSIDRKTIEEWALLGDPSLRIGGYP